MKELPRVEVEGERTERAKRTDWTRLRTDGGRWGGVVKANETSSSPSA
jgi:hypothetical protein